jgi:hypothetical protein
MRDRHLANVRLEVLVRLGRLESKTWTRQYQVEDGQIENQVAKSRRAAHHRGNIRPLCMPRGCRAPVARTAESSVDDLCHTSRTILFGAAVPGQRGRHHVNLQWQSFWASLFKARAYVAIDAIRAIVWNVGDILYWYRQNTLIYVHESQYAEDLAALQPLTDQSSILDVVHPDLLTRGA